MNHHGKPLIEQAKEAAIQVLLHNASGPLPRFAAHRRLGLPGALHP